MNIFQNMNQLSLKVLYCFAKKKKLAKFALQNDLDKPGI